MIGFINAFLQSFLITINYSAIAELPTSPILEHTKSSQSSLVVSWQRIYVSL
jgi:hypothetical protein